MDPFPHSNVKNQNSQTQDDAQVPTHGFHPFSAAPAFIGAPLPQGTGQPYVTAYLSTTGGINQPSAASFANFPHFADLVGKNPLYQPQLFAGAPCFHPAAVCDHGLMNQYVAAGRLPDGLPLYAICTEDWLSHWAIPDNAISRRPGESFAHARTGFTKLVYQRMRPTLSTVPLNEDWRMDTWAARTNREA